MKSIQNTDDNASRLEKINRTLTIAIVALVILVVLLAIIDFG